MACCTNHACYVSTMPTLANTSPLQGLIHFSHVIFKFVNEWCVYYVSKGGVSSLNADWLTLYHVTAGILIGGMVPF